MQRVSKDGKKTIVKRAYNKAPKKIDGRSKEGRAIKAKNAAKQDRKDGRKLMDAAYSADKAVLEQYMTPEFLEERLNWLEQRVGKKAFAEIKKAYMPQPTKDLVPTMALNLSTIKNTYLLIY